MTKKEHFEIPPLKTGVYRHYSGKEYEVITVACHSETLDWYVVYRPLYQHDGMPDTWIRPYQMFLETVEIEDKQVPRFQKVD